MSIFLLLPFGIAAEDLSIGYNEFVVSHNNSFVAHLKEKDMFLLFDETPPSYVHFSEAASPNVTSPVLVSELLSSRFSNTVLKISVDSEEQYILRYWLLPKNFCSEFSYALRADSVMEYSSAVQKSDLCLFSQVNVESSDLKIDIKSQSNEIIVYLFSNQVKRINYGTSGKCQFKTAKPFFVHIKDKKGETYKMMIAYAVNRVKDKLTQCGTSLIPYVVNGLPVFVNDILVNKNYECISSDESTLINMILVLSFGLILFLVFALLQLSGTIDICVLLGFQKKDKLHEINEGIDLLNTNQREQIYFDKTEKQLNNEI